MSLYTQLQHVKSEEDVKDAYIQALGLKGYTKGLIDIQTDEIWFEAKDTAKCSSYAMFTQLLHYVQVALNKGETVPPFLAVIDTEKAALMKSADVLPFLAKKTIKWGKSASQYTQEALDEISAHIGTHFVSFKIKTHEDEFISTVKAAILVFRGKSRTQCRTHPVAKTTSPTPTYAPCVTNTSSTAPMSAGTRCATPWPPATPAATAPVNFGPFEQAYQVLSDKLRPQVFTLGFLRV